MMVEDIILLSGALCEGASTARTPTAREVKL